jgi:prolyl oligopeptidase
MVRALLIEVIAVVKILAILAFIRGHLRSSVFICGSIAFAVAAQPAEDPYRYLEDASKPETQEFYKAQGANARLELDRLPARAKFAERVSALSNAGPVVTSIHIAAGRVFYLKLSPGEEAPALCMRDGLSSREKVLVSSDRFAADGQVGVIAWIAPSHDGRRVAYGVSLGAREEYHLRVVDVESVRDLPLDIDRVAATGIAWHPDSRAFYYPRIPEDSTDPPRHASIRIYRHVIGRATAQDEVVFAPGVGGARDVTPFVRPMLVIPLESREAYAIARDGVERDISVHVSDLKDLAAGKPRWRKIISPQDQVTAIEAWKGELFVLSHRGAPRSRVLRLDSKSPDITHARVAVPQGDIVIRQMGLARDALYLRTNNGGIDRLERLPIGLLGMKQAEYVRTPFDTAIAELVTHPNRPGAILRLEGWIDAPAVMEVDAKSGDLRNTGIQPATDVDFSAMDEVRLYAPGHDGTRIPVTLLYRKTTQLNAENPTLLVAHGSFGRSLRPGFDAARLAWLEKGGIFAIAHVRGGGEYGEEWHAQGRREAKANTVLDFISVADFLASYGFTSAKRLVIVGSGAGAVPVANALARKPEAFAAAILRDPLVDLLRYEAMPAGGAMAPEFGNAASLAKLSPYQQLQELTVYPATLVMVDARAAAIAPWQGAKFVARLHAVAAGSAKPILLRVEPTGMGEGLTREQRVRQWADLYSFAWSQVGDTPAPAAQ